MGYDATPTTAKPQSEHRWYHLTPGRFLNGLLAVEGFLLLSEWFCLLPFNEHKGWTVLIAVAVLCLALLMMLLWFGASLVSQLRFQFNIRSLMLFVALVAIVCSWFSGRMQQTRKQRAAVAAAERANGHAIYEHSLDTKGTPVPGTPVLPAQSWLQDMLGVDFFFDVEFLAYPQTTDVDIVHLKRLTSLECLDLSGSQATDAGLVNLKALGSLNELVLSGTQVSDAGLIHLKELTDLRHLRLDNTYVTDAGLAHLKATTTLERLNLNCTEVTDAGLIHLEGLPSLQDISLASSRVTDAGLAHLKKLPVLQYLDLRNTQVTDAGLEHLKGLRNLREVWLSCTEITDAGVQDLHTALPNCLIWQ